jgi:hypothetical protein
VPQHRRRLVDGDGLGRGIALEQRQRTGARPGAEIEDSPWRSGRPDRDLIQDVGHELMQHLRIEVQQGGHRQVVVGPLRVLVVLPVTVLVAVSGVVAVHGPNLRRDCAFVIHSCV